MREKLQAIMDTVVIVIGGWLLVICAVVGCLYGLYSWGEAEGECAAMKAELGRTVEIKVYAPEGSTATARDWFPNVMPNYDKLERDKTKSRK